MISQSQPRLLLTRPLAQSNAFSQNISDRFPTLSVIISPLMRAEIFPRPTDIPLADAVVFTSQTAIDAVAGWAGLPKTAYCVGAKTAAAANAAGYDAHSADGAWPELFGYLQKQCPGKKLIFLHAEETPLSTLWQARAGDLDLLSFPCYRQVSIPLSFEAQQILAEGEPVIVPLFSPRSAQLFLPYAKAARCEICVVALSQSIAASVRFPSRHLYVAQHPNSASMLFEIERCLLDAVPRSS